MNDQPAATSDSELVTQRSSLVTWRSGPVRDHILAFIAAVTDPGGAGYVPPAERLAVFDNDGTLWCEKPLMVHIYALLARYRQLARHEPLGLSRRALRAVFTNDHADFDNVFQRQRVGRDSGRPGRRALQRDERR